MAQKNFAIGRRRPFLRLTGDLRTFRAFKGREMMKYLLIRQAASVARRCVDCRSFFIEEEDLSYLRTFEH